MVECRTINKSQGFEFLSWFITTKKHNLLEGQLDQNVHIDQKVCPFWLKVWGMKNTCYIWPVHLIKVTFFTKHQIENLVKMDKCPSKWPWLSQIGHIEWIRFSQIEIILIWPLVKLTIMIWHLIKWTIFIWWLSLFVKPRLLT